MPVLGEIAPARSWAELPVPPLDLNGPTSIPFVAFDAGNVGRPIFQLFREVVEKYSDTIAVSDRVRQLSYRQLWNSACRLAQTIAAKAPSDRPVGILLPNDARYPVALLGCLAAGRPCVLLDRFYPAERNALIISDAGLSSIIVESADVGTAALYPQGLDTIAIDPAIIDPGASLVAPPDRLDSDGPAVIIYTSGSSGRPKGIVLSQRSILHRAGQLINSLHLTADDRSLPLGSPCTIAGMQQILETLLAGAQLVKLDLQRVGLGAALETIRDRAVTLLFATPTLLRLLLQLEGAGDHLHSLRCVHPSGEVLLGSDLDLLRRGLPRSCGTMVVYGLTEAPAISQWFVPRNAGEENSVRVAVGYRLPGYDWMVLDDDDRPVGPDDIGELVVRSRYTALGEWQHGRLTPGRFRPDPADPSLRILCTGDLVRLRADGLLAVAGRKDRQVKIHGMRVEPSEVENMLRSIPDVLNAVVVARPEGEYSALIAFVVLRSGERERALETLRARLRASLPPYMQPRRIVALDSLPLLPGYKVDVDALLALDVAYLASTAPLAIAVATNQRRHSSELVGQALSGIVDGAALDADIPFDQAGGDSFALLRLLFELEARCGVRLPLAAFDLSMRPSEIAQSVEDILDETSSGLGHASPKSTAAAGATQSPSPALRLVRNGENSVPIFIAGHGRLTHIIELVRHFRTRHAIYLLEAPQGSIDRVEDLARYFVDAVETVQPIGPYVLIGYCFGGLVVFEMAQQLSRRGRAVALLALLEALPHARFLPLRVWLRSLAHRTLHHARALIRLRPVELFPWLRGRYAAFAWHIGQRFDHPQTLDEPANAAEATPLQLDSVAAAFRKYRPRYYPGKLTLLAGRQSEPRLCDPTTVWGPLAKETEVFEVPGDHVTMILTETIGAQLSSLVRLAVDTVAVQSPP